MNSSRSVLCLIFIVAFLLINNICFAAMKYNSAGHKFSFETVHYTMLSYAAEDELVTYMDELTNKFKEIWDNKCPNKLKRSVTITFKINKDGSFSDLHLLYSSGNLEDDNAVLDLINNFKNIKPLPVQTNSVSIQYIFSPLKQDADYVKAVGSVNFEPYMRDLQKTLKSDWKPQIDGISKSAEVLFNIYKDGKIDEIALYTSSGNKEYDDIALNQVKNLKYFRPLPDKFSGESIVILFAFDLNVWSLNNTDKIPVIRNELSNKSSFNLKFEKLLKDLYILPKTSIRSYNDYLYIDALKINQFSSNAYIYHYKIDCENKKIGLKSEYAGSSTASPQELGFKPVVKPYTEDVNMSSFNRNNEYYSVYNYVCTQ